MSAEDNDGPIWDPTAPVPVRPIAEPDDHEPRSIGWRLLAAAGGALLAVGVLAGYGFTPRGGVTPVAAITAPTVTATEIHTFTPSPMTVGSTSIATVTANPQVARSVTQRVTDRVVVTRRVTVVRTVTVTRPGVVTVVHVTATRTIRVTR